MHQISLRAHFTSAHELLLAFSPAGLLSQHSRDLCSVRIVARITIEVLVCYYHEGTCFVGGGCIRSVRAHLACYVAISVSIVHVGVLCGDSQPQNLRGLFYKSIDDKFVTTCFRLTNATHQIGCSGI